MTKLGCGVETCQHNQEHLCCIGAIQVGGTDANTSPETCCESFVEKQSSFTNYVGSPELDTNIGCHATNCTYNEDGCCSAEAIEVAGQSACNCHETECKTFKEE